MSILDNARDVIRAWQKRHKCVMDENPDWAAQNLAIDLHNAGVLAPELPEPDHDSQDPKWRDEYGADFDYQAPDMWRVNHWISVGAFPQDNDVTIWDDGVPLEPFTIAETRKFACALLAAANKAEANKVKAER